MKLILVSIVLCVAVYAISATKLLASSSHKVHRREASLLKQLVKRQARNGENPSEISNLIAFYIKFRSKL